MTDLGWVGIARLGLVQSALGSIVMVSSSLLNRVMVVEYAQAATLPAALVAFHYAVQLTRPKWGHGSDLGRRRTPWIVGGMAILAAGGVLATLATLMLGERPAAGLLLAVLAYAMIGLGVGACGTSLLALLAARTAPARRPAAAALTWIMMIAGILVTAGIAGRLLEPFSPALMLKVVLGIAGIAFAVTVVAVAGIERAATVLAPGRRPPAAGFGTALRSVWADRRARLFTVFVFVSMVAYSAQDLILEPFAGLRFGMTPGQSTQLSSVQHMGVLAGMVLVGVGGHAFGGAGLRLKPWIIGGCLGSAAALLALSMAAGNGPGWPLQPTVFALGFANGVFAVAAIGAMMDLAGAGGPGQEGIRMGLWGAAQAIAFAAGGFFGAVGVDIGRRVFATDAPAFALVFMLEAGLFVVAALVATRLSATSPQPQFKEAMA